MTADIPPCGTIDWGFETARIRARLVDARDRALYRALYTDPAVMADVGDPLDNEGADSLFEKVLIWNREIQVRARYWHLVESASEQPVGLQSMVRDSRNSGDFELGMMVLPEKQGRGVASEVTIRLIDALFGERWPLDVSMVFARHSPANFRIGRIGAALGFESYDPEGLGLEGWRMTRERWLARPSLPSG